MNQIPTPETDAAFEGIYQPPWRVGLLNLAKILTKMRDLERRLTVARDALDKLARLGNEPNFGNSIGNEIAIKALAQTAPKQ